MNFEPTEDRRMLADTLQRYIVDRYGIEARNRVAYSKPGYSDEAWRGFAELGTMAALFPESHGGFGGSGFDIANVFEALGKGLVVEPVLGNLMVGHALLHAGDHEPLVKQLADGAVRAALAWEETAGRYDSSFVATTVTTVKEGWRINGEKCVVRQASAAEFFLVSARAAGSVDSRAGISLFLVPANTPGITLRTQGTVDGGSASEVTFTDVEVASASLVREPCTGHDLLERGLGAGLLALCAEALGAMQVARDQTLDYLRTRKQFGVPIGSFQALQHRMATLLLEVEQARSAVINAAAAFDGSDAIARERALSAAKYSIGRIGTLVAEEGIQMHGGIGMTWELPLSHYAKRLTMINHQLGDEDFHLERYMALGKPPEEYTPEEVVS